MKKYLLAVTLMMLTLTGMAIPAKRGQWTKLTLANGNTVSAQLMGDEHLHFWQDSDGRQYVMDDATQRFVRADMPRLRAQAATRRAKAAARRNRRMAQRKIGNYGNYTGQKKGLIILVEYDDVKFEETHNLDLYKQIANTENFSNNMGFVGSVHDYFTAQSRGLFDLTFDVYGPVPLANNQRYYGQNNSQGDDMHPEEMVIEACKYLQDDVDFSQYDWDGDGEVDQVFILYAGKGEANGGGRYTVWPHEWTLDEAGKELIINGMRINTYGCSCELQPGGIDGIGTICHEFSHCLGYPDMYDIDYGGHYGMDTWDLMDHGSYNGSGFIPAGYTSYERMAAGWLMPTELKGTMEVSGMKALSEGGESYIVYNKGCEDEYFLLENRQKTHWDSRLDGEGLLILRVDYDEELWSHNIVNSVGTFGEDFGFDTPLTNNHERCTPIHANNASTYSASPAFDTYPRGALDSLTNNSLPSTRVYNKNSDGSYYMNVKITDIKSDNALVSFRFTDDLTTGSGDTTRIDTLFYESFDQCAGTGGNDGKWSGSIASSTFKPDNEWEGQSPYGANQCAKVGASNKMGWLTTPEIQINGGATMTFRAAPWNEEDNFMWLAVEDGYNAELSQTILDPMTPQQWNDYSVEITAEGPLRLTIYSNKDRFFIDEICIIGPVKDDNPDNPDTPDDPQPTEDFVSLGMGTFTDGCLNETFLDSYGNSFNPVTYEVEIEESTETPRLYRLVNPYGPAYPYYKEGFYQDDADWYIEVDCSSRNGVFIDRQATGWDDGGMYDIQSVGSYRMSTGDDLSQLISEGIMGTLRDGIITFPRQGIYLFKEGNAEPIVVNQYGDTRIVLPNAAPDATTIDARSMADNATDDEETIVYNLMGQQIANGQLAVGGTTAGRLLVIKKGLRIHKIVGRY